MPAYVSASLVQTQGEGRIPGVSTVLKKRHETRHDSGKIASK
jgi:hypothetical protein